MRVSLVDPVSYTLPYDHSLAAALARRGHAVDLLTARFLLSEPPHPDGYRVHEVFFTGSVEHEVPLGTISAASVVISVPLIVMVLLFQKRIVAGLTAGAVKG